MCCKNCENKTCPNSVDFAQNIINRLNKSEATLKEAQALAELGKRLNLAPEVIKENFAEIASLLEWAESSKDVPRA